MHNTYYHIFVSIALVLDELLHVAAIDRRLPLFTSDERAMDETEIEIPWVQWGANPYFPCWKNDYFPFWQEALLVL